MSSVWLASAHPITEVLRFGLEESWEPQNQRRLNVAICTRIELDGQDGNAPARMNRCACDGPPCDAPGPQTPTTAWPCLDQHYKDGKSHGRPIVSSRLARRWFVAAHPCPPRLHAVLSDNV